MNESATAAHYTHITPTEESYSVLKLKNKRNHDGELVFGLAKAFRKPHALPLTLPIQRMC